jgi:hypothetical protein
MIRKLITMREALESDGCFGGLLAGDSWAAWRVLLIAIIGEELTEGERAIFESLTGRISEPMDPVEEFWAVIGRRSGKTRAMVILAAYLAACVDHRETLAPRERGVIPLLAASVQQAASAFAFVEGIFAVAQNLRDLVDGATSDTLSLTTGIDISPGPLPFGRSGALRRLRLSLMSLPSGGPVTRHRNQQCVATKLAISAQEPMLSGPFSALFLVVYFYFIALCRLAA